MADGVSFDIHGIAELKREMRAIELHTDRATMYAVREGGRQVKAHAKRNAPVLKDKRAITRREFKAGWEAGTYARGGATPPIKGLLRASIHTLKRLRRVGVGAYENRIGPRGERVHFYAGKIEALDRYMADAYATVVPELRVIAERAWGRSTRGRR